MSDIVKGGRAGSVIESASVAPGQVTSRRRAAGEESVLEAATRAFLEDASDGTRTPVHVDIVRFLQLISPGGPSDRHGPSLDRGAVRRLRRAAAEAGEHPVTLRVGDVVHGLARQDVEVLVQVADAVVRVKERLGAAVAGGALARVADSHPEHDPGSDEVLTSNEAAALLDVSRPHVIKLAKTGALPCRMVGSHHRFKRSDVERYDALRATQRDAALASIMVDDYLPGDF